MVKTIERIDSLSDTQHVPFMVARPKSVVIRFGRAFVVLVETSKKTLELFQASMEQLREFIETLRQAIIEKSHTLFMQEIAAKVQPAENPIPKWTQRTQEMRNCKKITLLNPKTGPLLKISKKAHEALRSQSPCETTQFGAGIANGQNCCFIASVLQALRVIPSFRSRLKSADLRNSPVVQELNSIYSVIEGTRKKEKRSLTGAEIDHFRATCKDAGFTAESQVCQDDSSHFCQFLLTQVGFQDIQIKEHNDHNFDLPVNALDKGRPIEENQVVFQLADTPQCDVASLIQKRKILVEVEKKLVRKDLEEKGLLTAEIEQKLAQKQDIELVQVEQTMKLYRGKLPPLLPVYLERGYWDVATQSPQINSHKIEPNRYVDFPLEDMPGYAVRYEWLSAVTREPSAHFSKESGHYEAWAARYKPDGTPVYNEYNASSSRLHTDTGQSAFENITKNSRLLFYGYRGIVKVS